ncbi:MAG: pyridoxamine 5'-phosphate oxidase [Acidimicrobiales bacterium]
MASLDTVRSFLTEEHGLAVVSTVQADGAVLSTVVNCGVIDHPVNGEPHLAFVSLGGAARLRHVRRGSPVTAAIRRGWNWVSVTGPAELIGPDDNAHDLDAERMRVLLRDVFTAAGGDHDDWDTYDQTMRDQARTAVLIAPDRIRGNV